MALRKVLRIVGVVGAFAVCVAFLYANTFVGSDEVLPVSRPIRENDGPEGETSGARRTAERRKFEHEEHTFEATNKKIADNKEEQKINTEDTARPFERESETILEERERIKSFAPVAEPPAAPGPRVDEWTLAVEEPKVPRILSSSIKWNDMPEKLRTKLKHWADMYKDRTQPPSKAWQALPKVALWLRTFTPGLDKLVGVFYESFEMFWPVGYGELVLVLDDESTDDHKMGKLLRKIPPYPRVIYMKEPDWDIFPNHICGRTKGYDRQMYSGFYADQHTDAEYIGLVDNDALFVSTVTPRQIFDTETGKPVVVGKVTRYNSLGHPFVQGMANGRWAEATERALGKRQAADFMWNFPVVIHRSAFPAVRRYMAERFNSTFEKAFFNVTSSVKDYCQINIILNYEWYFNRDGYKWHLQSIVGASKEFTNGTYNIPMAHPATHARGMNPFDIYAGVRLGYCLSCIAAKNCASPESMATGITLNHCLLFNWMKTPHLWSEKGVMTQPQAQKLHYDAVSQLSDEWTPNLDWILRHKINHYPDCARPPDVANCRDPNQRMHTKHLLKVAKHLRIRHDYLHWCVTTYKSIDPNPPTSARQWSEMEGDGTEREDEEVAKGNTAEEEERHNEAADENVKL